MFKLPPVVAGGNSNRNYNILPQSFRNFLTSDSIIIRETSDVLITKGNDVTELEHALKERQWEMTQRTAQLSKLETTVWEHKSLSEKKYVELLARAKKAEAELDERNAQIGGLDEALTCLRCRFTEQQHQLDEKTRQLVRLSNEIKIKENKIRNLEKLENDMRTTHSDNYYFQLEKINQLALVQEYLQQTASELDDVRWIPQSLQQEYDTLKKAIEELTTSLKSSGQHTCKEKIFGGADSKILINNDLSNSQKQSEDSWYHCGFLLEIVKALEKEILAMRKVIHMVNDTIVLKEAQVARLENALS